MGRILVNRPRTTAAVFDCAGPSATESSAGRHRLRFVPSTLESDARQEKRGSSAGLECAKESAATSITEPRG